MSRMLPNLIRNDWRPDARGPVLVSRILDHHSSPEGLDVQRIRFADAGSIPLDGAVGHFVSLLSGEVSLTSDRPDDPALQLAVTTHAYIPPGWGARLDAAAGTEVLQVSGGTAAQARGDRLIVRDEEFLAGCATGTQALRWVLTSQYLSRRIFLHHEATLASRSGAPVSWYRTTMFDVSGLPPNDDGEPVFKMAYNSRTEFNVCYRVAGEARVRMAEHPYRGADQAWGPWLRIDDQSTYHLNEAGAGEEEERWVDGATGETRSARNKHEVYIADGHVTLFCLFDPAPTGFERHRPGAYSDYEPLAAVVGTAPYRQYVRSLVKLDEMVDVLSLAKARGELDALRGSTLWRLYEQGRGAQAAHDATLLEALATDGGGRDRIVAQWVVGQAD
jgi:hypothetical protein